MLAPRILTVADVHQHRALLAELASAVERVRPAAVAFVGDRLDANGSGPGMAGLEECADLVANLQTPELSFVRDNQEEDIWPPFAWLLRGKGRKIVTLHGECHHVGAARQGSHTSPCLRVGAFRVRGLVGRPSASSNASAWSPSSANGSRRSISPRRRRRQRSQCSRSQRRSRNVVVPLPCVWASQR